MHTTTAAITDQRQRILSFPENPWRIHLTFWPYPQVSRFQIKATQARADPLPSFLPQSGFLVREHRLQQILIYHCYNEFTDELADRHVPERRLERESPDHVVSER
jgi:hypothetical protein